MLITLTNLSSNFVSLYILKDNIVHCCYVLFSFFLFACNYQNKNQVYLIDMFILDFSSTFFDINLIKT